MKHEAFRDFYHRYARPFLLFLKKTCQDEDWAQDVFQESFIRFLQRMPAHIGENQSKAYLYRIAINLVNDAFRRRKLEQNVRERQMPEACELHDSLLPIDMDRLFIMLNSQERTLLWLATVEGCSHTQIADMMGIGAGSVRVKLYRVKKKFSAILRENGYDG